MEQGSVSCWLSLHLRWGSPRPYKPVEHHHLLFLERPTLSKTKVEQSSFTVHLLFQVYCFATRRNMRRSRGRNVKRMKPGAQFWARLCRLSVTWPGEINSPPGDKMLPLHNAAKPRDSQVCCENHTGKTARSTEQQSIHLAGNSIITHNADSGTDIGKTASGLVFLLLATIFFKCQIPLAALSATSKYNISMFLEQNKSCKCQYWDGIVKSKLNQLCRLWAGMSSLVSVTIYLNTGQFCFVFLRRANENQRDYKHSLLERGPPPHSQAVFNLCFLAKSVMDEIAKIHKYRWHVSII